MGIQAVTNPWLLAVSPDHREALKETFDMGAGIVTTVVDDIVSGDFYAIGGYVFDVASMFVGVGQVTTALKGTKLVGKLAEELNVFKTATKVTTISKLGKITNVINKSLKYGDDAVKAFASKLKNVPLPIMDEIALAGGGSVKVMGKGTIGDYIKMAKANFSKGNGAIDDVVEKASGANLNKLKPNEINNMSLDELRNSIPKDWQFFENNGRVHIKDANGNFRVRIDPPDKVTNYEHMHIFDENKNPLDINGNIVDKKSPDGHIPWTNK